MKNHLSDEKNSDNTEKKKSGGKPEPFFKPIFFRGLRFYKIDCIKQSGPSPSHMKMQNTPDINPK
jgi:hypothetical protein